MNERDYVMRQIQQLTQVLAVILTKFFRIKSAVSIEQAIEFSNEQLKSQVDIDLDALIQMSKHDMYAYLKERNMNADQFDALSEYLFKVGESMFETHSQIAISYLHTALLLHELAEEYSNTLSLDGMHRVQAIRALLES